MKVLSSPSLCFFQSSPIFPNGFGINTTIQLTVGSFGNQYLTEFSSKPGGPWSANVISAMEMEIYGKITAANKTHLYWCANKAMDNGIVDKAIYTTISKTIQNFLSKTNSKYEKNECKH
jgi:hypothetical protein